MSIPLWFVAIFIFMIFENQIMGLKDDKGTGLS